MYSKIEALQELEALKFSFAALAESHGAKGSYDRELAYLANKGFSQRVEYLKQSIDKLLKP
jgi:hypothetical protein